MNSIAGKTIRRRHLPAVILALASSLLALNACNAPAPPVAAAMSTPQPSSGTADPAPSMATADPKAFTTTGPLVAEQQADIAAERDGRIVHIAVQIGDHVQTGQLLALLDDRALHAALDSQKARVLSLQAQVREWQAEQKAEEADLRRADIMRKEQIRSEEDWEHVKYKLDETVAEVARYQADQAAAEADLKSAELALAQSRIVAPFNGVIGRSSLRLAQEVKKGDVLLWITAVQPLRVLFTVPESAMASFQTGAPLELTTASYPQLRQSARILRVSPVVDPASASVQVIGIVPHPSSLLKPGMTMQIRRATRE